MIVEYIRISFDTVKTHRFRTFLTLLAIILGSFSIVLMTSLAESGLATMLSGVEEMGGYQMLLLVPKRPERVKEKAFYSKGLNAEDVILLNNRLPFIEHISGVKTIGGREIKRPETNKSQMADIIGADQHFINTFKMNIAKGRNFTQNDFDNLHRVIILGQELKQRLFGDSEALHERVTLFNIPYQVIGTLEKNYKLGIQMGFDWNLNALIPEATLTEREGYASPLEIIIITQDPSKNDIVKRVMNRLIEEKHRYIDDFEFLDFNSLMNQFEYILTTIKIVVAFVASIALVIGGVGIMNIMLVSVNERTREIGIRRAIGATPRSITHQFLIEAGLLTVIGSIIGIIIAFLLKMLIDWIVASFILPPWTGVLSLASILYALFAAVAVGLIFGYFPAKRASKLNIDECLRVERG